MRVLLAPLRLSKSATSSKIRARWAYCQPRSDRISRWNSLVCSIETWMNKCKTLVLPYSRQISSSSGRFILMSMSCKHPPRKKLDQVTISRDMSMTLLTILFLRASNSTYEMIRMDVQREKISRLPLWNRQKSTQLRLGPEAFLLIVDRPKVFHDKLSKSPSLRFSKISRNVSQRCLIVLKASLVSNMSAQGTSRRGTEEIDKRESGQSRRRKLEILTW